MRRTATYRAIEVKCEGYSTDAFNVEMDVPGYHCRKAVKNLFVFM